MKTQSFPLTTRASLLQTALGSRRQIAGLAAGATLLGVATVQGQTDNSWTGATSSDWNEPTNWSNGSVPSGTAGESGEHAVVNTITPNIAVISSDISATPVDIFVGTGGGNVGRLDHTAGTAATGDVNWMYVGHDGAAGTYNLADVNGSGGSFTGFGLGTGNMNVGNRLYVAGQTGTGSSGTVNVNTEGTLAIGGELQVGTNESVGVVNLDSGAITTGGWTEFGQGSGSTGTLNMSGGSITKEGGDNFTIGNNGGNGTANQTGGDIMINSGELFVGNNGAEGVYNLDGGSVSVDNWVAIGRDGGTGTVNVTGGTFTKTGGGTNFIIGASGGGEMTQSGGVVDVQEGITWIGEQTGSTGTLSVSESAEFNSSVFSLAVQDGTTGTLNLNGGTVRTSQITGGSGDATVNFNGTQILATADQSDFISGLDTATVGTGGLLIDSSGFVLTVSQQFAGSGGITKSGDGSLDLTGDSTITGEVMVSAGTLYVNGDLGSTSGTTVDEFATVGGSGTLGGPVTVNGTVAPGNSVGTMNAAEMTIAEAGIYLAELDGDGVNDRLNIAGNLAINGMIEILLNYSPNGGDSFDLADFATFSGDPEFDFSGATLDSGLSWDTSTFESDGVISVVPEPSAALLALFGCGGLALRRRRS